MNSVGKKKVKGVVILPFYDGDIQWLEDTVESITYYLKSNYILICVNDCRDHSLFSEVKKRYDSDRLIFFTPDYPPEWPRNGYGPLFYKLYQCVEFALSKYEFDYLIKIDVDALITGSDLFMYVDDYYRKNPRNIGLIGSYKIKANGQKRTRWSWVLYLYFIVYIKKQLSRKSIIWKVVLPIARKQGYRLGESVLGGAYIYKYECIKQIVDSFPYKKLLQDNLEKTRIGEDILFSLLTYASGFKIQDFGRPNDPLAIAHQVLPIKKEDVISKNKQIIHSVKKGLNGETESQLRAFFRDIRISLKPK